MKYYKCDLCGEPFAPKGAMVEGWYADEKSADWKNPNGTTSKFIIRKTIKLYQSIKPDDQLAPREPIREVQVKKDLCKDCVQKMDTL